MAGSTGVSMVGIVISDDASNYDSALYARCRAYVNGVQTFIGGNYPISINTVYQTRIHWKSATEAECKLYDSNGTQLTSFGPVATSSAVNTEQVHIGTPAENLTIEFDSIRMNTSSLGPVTP